MRITETFVLSLFDTGSALYVYCIVVRSLNSNARNTTASVIFLVDNDIVGNYSITPIEGPLKFDNNTLIYKNQSLSADPHLFTLQIAQQNSDQALVFFDYFVYS